MADVSQLTEEQKKALQEKLKNMSPEELMELQRKQCIFCQIVAGKVPAKKVFEDESLIAILDINPAAKGHILVLPKEHYAIMPQVPEEVIGHLFVACKTLSNVLLKTLQVSGTNVFIANGLVAGQRAQHFMIHVIPRKEGDHLLPIQDILLDGELMNKVRIALENKINALFGVQKEVVELPTARESPETIVKEPSVRKEKQDVEKEHTKKKEEKPSAKPAAKKGRRGQDASLDDIANLFR